MAKTCSIISIDSMSHFCTHTRPGQQTFRVCNIEAMAIESSESSMKNGGSSHSFLYVYQRVIVGGLPPVLIYTSSNVMGPWNLNGV